VLKSFAKLAAATILLGIAAVSDSEAAPAGTIVGFWYGLGEPGDPEIFYIDAFHADGSFNAEYRKCEKGKLSYRQTQSGTWKIANGVLTINSTVINGAPGRFDHLYTIEMLTLTEFLARLHDPNFLFVERRIPRFEFPACYLGS